MSNVVISIEHLYKQYRLGLINHGMLYNDIQSWWAKKRGKPDPNAKIIEHKGRVLEGDKIWALHDISLDIKDGDILGIIGKNGAGKSTLLKVLSQITAPTKGLIKIKGRISSLLEVGTGFHPELTGRENAFLNGAILGMNKKEIQKKFDDIVGFAEIEEFIDTPVKRYSSGMYVRLAFAIASFLEPEILIVDEVLAVGDISFQKRCLGKMEDVSRQGRTILFVSHNMAAIEQLCKSAVVLNNGKIQYFSNDVKEGINHYIKSFEKQNTSDSWTNSDGKAFENDYFTPLEIYVSNEKGEKLTSPFRNDEIMLINIVGRVKKIDPALIVAYNVFTEDGMNLYGTACTDATPDMWPKFTIGITTLKARLPNNLLNEGKYKIEIYIGLLNKQWFAHIDLDNKPSFLFEIRGGLSNSPYWTFKRKGILAPQIRWSN